MAQDNTVQQLNYGRKVHDFMRWNNLAFGISLSLLLASILIIATRGFYWGLDFTGGTVFEITLENPADLDEIRATLKEAHFSAPILQHFGSNRDVMIRIPATMDTPDREMSQRLITVITTSVDSNAKVKRIEFIGPSVGSELAQAGAMALLVALLCILIYVGVRFEWRLALGAVIALAHDVVITLGVLSLLNVEINLTIVASLMSVIGYSLNDSIVISDRIRENFRKTHHGTTQDIINVSLTQTLSRTIMTSATTLVVVLMLYFFGGTILQGFSLTMLIGISIGTLSSIYVASALALKLGMKREHMLVLKVEKEGADQTSPFS